MSLGTDNATADFIRRHLDDDIEEVAQQPNQTDLRPSLAPFLSHDGLFRLPEAATDTHEWSFLLQVMSVKDVSLSREQRCRALVRAVDLCSGSSAASADTTAAAAVLPDDAAAMVDATLQAMEEQDDEAQPHAPLRPSGGQWRCLRLELSDGFTRILAVEKASSAARPQHGAVFAPDGLSLGCKIAVRVSSMSSSVQHGVLRLHAGNTDVLGGRVRALEVYWETQARLLLAASTGRPSRQQQQQQQLQQQPLTMDGGLTRTVPPSAAPPPQPQQASAAYASPRPQAQLPPPVPTSAPPSTSPPPPPPLQPLRCWPAHAAQHPAGTPFVTVAFITEVVSDMVINEPSPLPTTSGTASTAAFTYALLAQLSSPDAVERLTQPTQPTHAAEVTDDDHLVVNLGHAWLRRLVGMPAEDFRALSLSHDAGDVARLTATVEAVGQALEQFGKGRFTLAQRPGGGMVEVIQAVQEN